MTLLLMAFLMSVPAFAHSKPRVMEPAPNSTVDAPNEISVIFSEPLDPKFSSLSLNDEKGSVISTAQTIADPANHMHLSLHLPKLGPGTYSVHWVSAAVDGHRMDGEYTFRVK
jgi:methionine-rich copper-binding protein CopC